jgi:transketolase N-terminal domain/subunit
MQQADAMGRSFQFNKQEARDNSKMTFLRQSYTTANAGIKGARMAKANAVGQIASSFGSLGDSLAPGAGLALGKELGLGNLSGK